jgi:hypothetical protein
MQMVKRWVDLGGGMIVVAGPVNTVELARPSSKGGGGGAERQKLKDILDIYPVILRDVRLQDLDRESKEPWRLSFPGATPDMEFLWLEEKPADKEAAKSTQFLDAWEKFFAGDEPGGDPKGPSARGFYSCYPVEDPKPTATIIATFSDPKARLKDVHDQPYLVSMPFGGGKMVWLGSGEMWRLREVSDAYHERFWTKLARYASSGSVTKSSRRVILVHSQSFPSNTYATIEAHILGRDMQPLPKNAKPTIELTPPSGVQEKDLPNKGKYELNAKPGNEGWFIINFPVEFPGEYKINLKVPETGDTDTGKVLVKEANPELDNTRPDLEAMYNLASDADEVLKRLPSESLKKELRQRLARVRNPEAGDANEPGEKAKLKLLFDLRSAELIPSCMVYQENTQRINGPVTDLWDKGFIVPGTREWDNPFRMSWVLLAVVTLLSIEWLTRKLLRLA